MFIPQPKRSNKEIHKAVETEALGRGVGRQMFLKTEGFCRLYGARCCSV